MALKEIWHNVKGYEGLYLISTYGRVLSAPRNGTKLEWHILAPHFVGGYVQYELSKSNKTKAYKAHRLVAEAFLPNPERKREVNHIDGDKHNNKLENLEWSTSSENQLHASYILGKGLKAVKQLSKDGELVKVWRSIKEASLSLGIDKSDISNASRGKRLSAGGYKWQPLEVK